MFASIRRHQQWLFAIIIGVVIISFVILFTPNADRMLRGGRTTEFGLVEGQPVTYDEYVQGQAEAKLMFRFNSGEWPDRSSMARQMGYDGRHEALSRVLLARKLQEMGVQVGDDAVVDQIRRFFRDQNQQYDPAKYQQFVKQDLAAAGISEDMFFEFLRHELERSHLSAVFGLPGRLMTTRAAEEQYRRENEQVVTEAVFLSASNYLFKVKVEPSGLSQFYTNHIPNYELSERRQANYVAFEAINYLSEAGKQMAQQTNLTAGLEQEYERRGTNAFTDATGKVLAKAAALEKMKDELRHVLALREARRKANDFATLLFERVPKAPDQLVKLAAEKGLTAKVTAPFSRFDAPRDINDTTTEFARRTFALTDEEPFVAPVVGTNAVYVLTLNKTIPREIPPLDKVKERVTEDYKSELADQEMQKAGHQIYQAITNGLAHGKSFKSVCQEKQLKVVEVPAFSQDDQSLPTVAAYVSAPTYRRVAFGTPTGQVSNFIPVTDRGFILHVTARKPVAADKMKKDLPEYVKDMRDSRQGRAFGEWFGRLAQEALPPRSISTE